MPQTVYGYITLENDDEAEIERLHDQLTAYAQAAGLALAEVIVDRNTPPGRVIRAGLTVLLDAVLRTEDCGVLVASPEHLSSVPSVRRAVEVEIEGLGGKVIYLSESGEPAAPPSRASLTGLATPRPR